MGTPSAEPSAATPARQVPKAGAQSGCGCFFALLRSSGGDSKALDELRDPACHGTLSQASGDVARLLIDHEAVYPARQQGEGQV